MTLNLGDIAEKISAKLHGEPQRQIHSIGTLDRAGQGEISFFSNRRYLSQLKATSASAVILTEDDRQYCPVDALVVDDPYLSYARLANILYPAIKSVPGIHPTAQVNESADVDSGCEIGAYVSIGKDTTIAENSIINHGVVIGDNVKIGKNCRIYPNVVIYQGVILGDGVTLHSGVIIGADGFGIANDHGQWLKIPQLGSVEIGNNVEIGANTTIDRGAIENTIIADGVKIDNQVQIGHNVIIGKNTAIAGCVAIAGSTRIGERCMIGGASGISGHIDICNDVILMAMSGVNNSIKEAGIYASGLPVMDVKSWRKNVVSFKQLYNFSTRLRRLEDNSDSDD